jgi:GNAT superfamily N-acetyltransferase
MGINKLDFHPLTSERWADFEKLFGPRGATGGCWCMYWRTTQAEYERQKGDGNRAVMRAIVESGEIPGILAYSDGRAVGWCSVAPREAFPRLERSRILKRVDESPVWSVVCFFVEKGYRNQGLTVALLKAAAEYVRQHDGKIIEGYPVEPKLNPMPPVFAYTGLASAFQKAGFAECARRSETRPIMRLHV